MEMSQVQSTATLAIQSKQALVLGDGAADSKEASSSDNHYRSSKSTGTPLMGRVYADRVTVMHTLVQAAAQTTTNETSICCPDIQLLALGCGYDNSYDKYFKRIYSVDLPETISAAASSSVSVSTKKFSAIEKYFIPCDISQSEILKQSLEQVGFDRFMPTIVLIECVLVYISEKKVQELLTSLSSYLTASILIIYDPLRADSTLIANQSYHCHDNYYRLFSESFLSVNSKGSYIPYGKSSMSSEESLSPLSPFSSIEGWSHGLRSWGWHHVNAYSMQEAVPLFSKDNSTILTNAEGMFDEYAALAKLRSLYAVCVASSSHKLWSKMYKVLGTNETASLATFRNHSRIQALYARIWVAEMRLRSLLATNELVDDRSRCAQTSTAAQQCMKTLPYDAKELIIRRMTSDWECHVAADIYAREFAALSSKYSSVRKFVNSAVKEIRSSGISGGVGSQHRKKDITFFVAVLGCNLPSAFNGEVVGCIGIRTALSSSHSNPQQLSTEIINFCVSKSYQRHGIGGKLLDKALEFCSTNEITQIDLSVHRDLTQARKLYDQVGFQFVSSSELPGRCIVDRLVRIAQTGSTTN